MSGHASRSKWLRRLAHAGLVAGVVIGLGATPGCLCRPRTYVPGGGVVVTRPIVGRPVVTRPVVRVAPAPAVRVGTPVARPAAGRQP
jgi:hypothetical protein